MTFLDNHPKCFSSPTNGKSIRLASNKAFFEHLSIARCKALNHIKASCVSVARKMQECTASGECSSKLLCSGKRSIVVPFFSKILSEMSYLDHEISNFSRDVSVVAECNVCLPLVVSEWALAKLRPPNTRKVVATPIPPQK